MIIPVSLYMIRNKDGHWLRSLGQDSYGKKSWVEDPKDAKIWTKLSQAHARITWWAKAFPQYGIPELWEITNAEATLIDQTERVSKALLAMKRTQLRNEISYAKWRLEELKKEEKPVPKVKPIKEKAQRIRNEIEVLEARLEKLR